VRWWSALAASPNTRFGPRKDAEDSNSHFGLAVCGRGGTRPSKSAENAGFAPGGPASTPAVSRKAAIMRIGTLTAATGDLGVFLWCARVHLLSFPWPAQTRATKPRQSVFAKRLRRDTSRFAGGYSTRTRRSPPPSAGKENNSAVLQPTGGSRRP